MTTGTAWSTDAVLALAPDAASVSAGAKLAVGGRWTGTGATGTAVWGLCAGSGKSPYQTVVDLTGPAFRCSCPSRKFPCKHALALLLLWSGGAVPVADEPADFALSWLEGRERAAPQRETTPDPEAAAARAARRAERVTAGLAELEVWLADQVRTGLAGREREGYGYGADVAARMVDAQAPGIASALRRLPGVVLSGDGWPGRLLEHLADLHLLARAHRRLEDLPAVTASGIRARVGYPVKSEDVLARPGVRDEWAVTGLRDEEQDRLTVRRVWLRGNDTGRDALVLTFTPEGRSPDDSLVPGTVLDADLHFHDGPAPLRALVGTRYAEPRLLRRLPDVEDGQSLAAALAGYADAVVADPWTERRPVVVAGVVPVPGEPWVLADATTAVPVDGPEPWRLLAVAGGHPVTVTGEFSARGLRPLGVLAHGIWSTL